MGKKQINKHELIKRVIKEKKTLSFYYVDTTEPGLNGIRVRTQVVAYGISTAGRRVVRAWIDKRSVSYSGTVGWRLFRLDGMSKLKIETIPWRVNKPGMNKDGDKGMKVIFEHVKTIQVNLRDFSPADVDEINKALKKDHNIIKKGQVESVLHSASYYKNRKDQAAAVLRGIAAGQIYGDGNKRTATTVASAILGRELRITPKQVSKITNKTSLKWIKTLL